MMGVDVMSSRTAVSVLHGGQRGRPYAENCKLDGFPVSFSHPLGTCTRHASFMCRVPSTAESGGERVYYGEERGRERVCVRKGELLDSARATGL